MESIDRPPATISHIVEIGRKSKRNFFHADNQKKHQVRYFTVCPDVNLMLTAERKTSRSKPKYFIRSYDDAANVEYVKNFKGYTKYQDAKDDFELLKVAKKKSEPESEVTSRVIAINPPKREEVVARPEPKKPVIDGLYISCLNTLLSAHIEKCDLYSFNPDRLVDIAYELHQKSLAKFGLNA